MAAITITFPDVELVTAIMTILAFLWTLFQEYRHVKDNKSVRPAYNTQKIAELEKKVNVLGLRP
jgi:hypothetical protein